MRYDALSPFSFALDLFHVSISYMEFRELDDSIWRDLDWGFKCMPWVHWVHSGCLDSIHLCLILSAWMVKKPKLWWKLTLSGWFNSIANVRAQWSHSMCLHRFICTSISMELKYRRIHLLKVYIDVQNVCQNEWDQWSPFRYLVQFHSTDLNVAWFNFHRNPFWRKVSSSWWIKCDEIMMNVSAFRCLHSIIHVSITYSGLRCPSIWFWESLHDFED